MNSANRLMMNSTRKIHSDQKPRLLALKGEAPPSQRRDAPTEEARLRWQVPRQQPSCRPALEIDARIDQGIGDVADQFHHQPHQAEDVQGAEDHRVVAVDRAS